MQIRSNLWKELAASGNVKMETAVVIDGHEYTPKSDVAISRTLGQNALSIGNTITATVQFSIEAADGVEIPDVSAAVVKIRYVDGERATEWVERGTFYVSRRQRNVISEILDFQGYDAMIRADAPFPSLSGFPKAMNSVVMEIAHNMGVEVDTRTWTDFPTGNDYYVSFPANGEKMIKVLGYIGGVCGGNWVITPLGRLRLVPLASASGAASASDKAEIAAIMSGIVAGESVTVTGVSVTGQKSMLAGTDEGAVVTLTQNPYITQTTLNALLTRYEGLTYAPYEIKSGIYDPATEIGDYLLSREDVASVAWAENARYVSMFRGDLSTPFLTETPGNEQSISDAINDTDSGYKDLSVHFYYGSNQGAVTIADGQSAVIIDMGYAAGAGQDVIFHAEVKHTTATTETGSAATGWTVGDAVLTVTYYIDGIVIGDYHPVKVETDGANLLHLNYQRKNTEYVVGRFQVALALSGGSVSIAAGDARAYIIGQGDVGGGIGDGTDERWVTEDGLVFIGVESYPKLNYEYDETLDLTGLVVKAYYANGNEEDITEQCTVTPAHGAELEEGENVVSISYTDGEKTFSDSFSVYSSGDGYRVLYIEVEQPPDKTEYLLGETLDLSGLVVVAVQENGWVVRNIKPDCTFSPAEGDVLTDTGTVTVTVTRRYLEPLDYGTFTAYFDITVGETGVIASGDWWTLYDTGLLDIYCVGNMPIPTAATLSEIPWYVKRSRVTGVIIRDGVTNIRNGAFADYYTNLTSVTIPGSVTYIGGVAFRKCSSLTSVTIGNGVTSIQDSVFGNCTSLASVTIPDSVTYIGSAAFGGCSSLTSVKIPNSVTEIGSYAFQGCTSLASVTIPDGITTIPVDGFVRCTSLASVTIPDSVTTIHIQAFAGCNALTDVYYSGTETQWNAINIWSDNDPLLNATIHYNSTGPT